MKIEATRQVRYPNVQVQPYLLVPVTQVTYALTAMFRRGRIGRVSLAFRFTGRAIVPEAFRDDDEPRYRTPLSTGIRIMNKDER